VTTDPPSPPSTAGLFSPRTIQVAVLPDSGNSSPRSHDVSVDSQSLAPLATTTTRNDIACNSFRGQSTLRPRNLRRKPPTDAYALTDSAMTLSRDDRPESSSASSLALTPVPSSAPPWVASIFGSKVARTVALGDDRSQIRLSRDTHQMVPSGSPASLHVAV
jgi:hypothetical protein